MKKIKFLAALTALASLGFTSCDEFDSNPVLVSVETAVGVFVANSGNQSGKIDGSLTYFDYGTSSATQNVYQAINGKSLGMTIPGMVVYGSKLYIVGSLESTVFIADKQTIKEIAAVKVEKDGAAVKIRQAAAGNGHVYISSYSNTVFAIDTLTNQIDQTFTSGDYSDGICYCDGYVYTGDTDYGRYGKATHGTPSVTKINVKTGQSTIITNDKFRNPTSIVAVGGRIFVQDKGYYGGADGSQIEQNLFELNTDGSIKQEITPASSIAASSSKIYIISAPYSKTGTTATYKVYDVNNGTLDTFCAGTEIQYPNMISVDAINNLVYVTSYQLKEGTQSANYKVASYACIYNGETGEYLYKFDCGVGAGMVVPATVTKQAYINEE